MARTWTTHGGMPGDQFKADHVNDEANAIAQQVNGQLDQNNMPLETITHEHFVDPVVENNVYGDNTLSTYMSTQSYHQSTYAPANEEVEQGDLGPNTIFTTNWEDDNWNPFWNSIDTNTGAETLIFRSNEGMIYGGVTLSLERRTAYKVIYDNGVPSYFVRGEDTISEIGVFCNDVLIARTGEITTGAITIDLPFSCPIGSELCTIEVKFKSSQGVIAGTAGIISGVINTDVNKFFACSGWQLWARNQYR